MKKITYLLSAYILTKPFYLWHSGLPQISDYILLVAFFVMLLCTNKKKIMQTIKDNIKYFYFLFFVVIINSLYAFYYDDTSFLIHGLYYVFDALGIILFVHCFKFKEKPFEIFLNSFKVSLFLQLAIFLANIGRYYDPTRYMGTFNDPNQFAYYCFLSFSFIYILSRRQGRKTDIIYFILALFLIIKSASTGMLLGMAVFAVLYLIPVIKNILKRMKKYALLCVVALLPILLFGMNTGISNLGNWLNMSENDVALRIEQKISRAKGNESIDLWQERGYDHIYYYPYYIIFGAGEGGYWRFTNAFHQDEIHATLPTFLFCYGIIPTTIILLWFKEKMKKQSLFVLSIYFALLFESFTLVNSRQVLFWVIFAISPYLMGNAEKKETELL